MASLLDFLHGLTKTEVTGPDGQTKLYNPSETDSGKAPGKNALQLLLGEGKQEMAGVQPETDTHNVQLPEQSGPSISSLPPELQAIFGVQPPANPGSESVSEQNNPSPLTVTKPSLRQASMDAAGLPTANSPRLTTKGRSLIAILNGGLGALAGSGQRTAAGGFEAAMEQPIQRAAQRQQLERGNLENQNLRQTIQYNPFLRALGIQKSQADIAKSQADAAKSSAEAGAIPSKTALERAQTEAAYYKDDPNLGLIDIRTNKPVNGSSFAPLSPEEAGILGKQPNERVPLKLKNTANEMVNRGIRPVQAGGRSLLVDSKGNTIKDMGASTPVIVNNMNNGPNGGAITLPEGVTGPAVLEKLDPVTASVVKGIGDGDLNFATQAARLPKVARQSLIAAVRAYNPSFNEASFDIAKNVESTAAKAEVPTNIGNQKVAFNTMIDHAELLRKAAKALKNGDNRTLAGLKNAINTEFGVPDVTDFNAIANAYNHEVTAVVSKGHITDSEVKTGGATMPSNANFETIDRVLNSYKSLAQSKMKNLNKQKDAAVSAAQGKGAASPGEITVIDPDGGVHAFPDQKAADAYKVAVGIK